MTVLPQDQNARWPQKPEKGLVNRSLIERLRSNPPEASPAPVQAGDNVEGDVAFCAAMLKSEFEAAFKKKQQPPRQAREELRARTRPPVEGREALVDKLRGNALLDVPRIIG